MPSKNESSGLFVTFEDYNGSEVKINPAQVRSISTYQHHEEHLDLPPELLVTNGDGFPEVSADPELKAEANRLRTSERVIISIGETSYIVKGTLAEVEKALG